jgi:hypothetical protein
MYSVRKVKTKSGSTAIQVVQYVGHRSKIAKHIGSSKDNLEIDILRRRALDWIDEQTAQTTLFPEQKQRVLVVEYNQYPHTRPANKGNFHVPFSYKTDNKKSTSPPNIKMEIATALNVRSQEKTSPGSN